MRPIGAAEGPAHADDWNHHWQAFGENVLANPASEYRHRIIVGMLGSLDDRSTVVDIGSGQGELALLLKRTFPDSQVIGLEYSKEGVQRGQRAAAEAALSITFRECDLLREQAGTLEVLGIPEHVASHAVCSEVLEHVDQPARLLRNARAFLRPGCRIVVTVPAGPRSAFDRHIGHRRHFTRQTLSRAIQDAGLVCDHVYRAGFPFFNLYRLVVILRGRRLVRDTSSGAPLEESPAARRALAMFDRVFRWNTRRSPWGWQLVALAHEPGGDA